MMFFLSLGLIQNSYSENLNLFTNSKVYSEGQPLLTYGNGSPNEDLIIRLFAPDGTIANFDQIKADKDGTFNHVLLVWPSPSANFPYGTYTVEIISPEQNGISKRVDVKFTSTSELVDVPVDRQINTIVFVPETGVRNEAIRVFVQTTSDGLLIEGEPTNLLATTHVHLPNGSVENLSNSFQTLHQGLYYVDYVPKLLGTYVFHVVTFHQGTVSHGSAATTILSQDIKGISEQIIELNSILDETSSELNILKSEIEGFGSTLEKASGNIDTSVSTVSNSVRNIEEASVQLNSLLFPIVASIGIIVALQIVIIARRR
ncbi:MAG: methyl-accepting chemotaxis protein [Crenarchaeota archaeon]|nr:MAG: methyl-accepting chemotaxis protein [Thermoproteota archaeon]RDJ33634.1 MAG: methyl-accepting chemotaxis protein [Thermoproteota archaeon]RDJ38163.1 MAG: methyl-accepting chemotaxis protein [Thermoproteota archaeon]